MDMLLGGLPLLSLKFFILCLKLPIIDYKEKAFKNEVDINEGLTFFKLMSGSPQMST